MSDLRGKKEDWLSSVPKLPDVSPEITATDDPRGRPGSEMPELSSDVPLLPDIDLGTKTAISGQSGSEPLELSSDAPTLPDIKIEVIDSEYIPEMPEINTGRPGSEIPELSSDVPTLPDVSG